MKRRFSHVPRLFPTASGLLITVFLALGCATSVGIAFSKTGIAGSDALASVYLTKGWATFGQVLPRGAVRDVLRIGNLPTQADVKTRWPDGSVRFAVVTAQIPSAGTYPVTVAAASAGTFIPLVPAVSVAFRMGGAVWTARLPVNPSTDVWLSGPLVVEWRQTVAPVRSNGKSHPYLRVIFDYRSYVDGQGRLDVTVENTLDIPGAGQVRYDVDIISNGQVLFHRDNVTHYYLTRWRKVFPSGLTESDVTPDLESVYQAKALPRYLSIVSKIINSPRGPNFDILRIANLLNPMSSHGGRPEIAPYPDWTARYLVHKNPTQRRYVMANGSLAGSWPMHIREPDGRLISIDERPGFWLDGRERKYRPDGPRAHIPNGGPAQPYSPDIAHQPSFAYVPYLISGDRYYADEMAFWANYVLIGSWPGTPRSDSLRKGSTGLIVANQVRAIGWGLRNMVDAAAYLPDANPLKSYFREKVENNLRWADSYADGHRTPLKTSFENKRPENNSRPPKRWIAQWEHNYLAWALDHAAEQGFTGGSRLRDRIVKFQLSLFISPDYPRMYGAPYILAIGEKLPNGRVRYYDSLRQVFRASYGNPPTRPSKFRGYHGVSARLMLLIAMKIGLPRAEKAYNYLHKKIGVEPHRYKMPDLARRSGWAIDPGVAFMPKR